MTDVKKKKKKQREQVKTAKNLLNMFFFSKQSRTKANIVTGNDSLVQYLKPGKNQSAKVLT